MDDVAVSSLDDVAVSSLNDVAVGSLDNVTVVGDMINNNNVPLATKVAVILVVESDITVT